MVFSRATNNPFYVYPYDFIINPDCPSVKSHVMKNSLLAKILRYSDGTSGLTATGDGCEYLVRIGRGHSAVISRCEGEIYEEAIVSGAVLAAATVSSIVRVGKQLVEKRVFIEYANKALREDSITISNGQFKRATEWKYSNGVSVTARYAPGSRTLEIFDKHGRSQGSFLSQGIVIGSRFQASTQAISGPDIVEVFGENRMRPLSLTIEPFPSAFNTTGGNATGGRNAAVGLLTISKSLDGTTKIMQTLDRGRLLQSNTATPYGTISTFLWAEGTHADDQDGEEGGGDNQPDPSTEEPNHDDDSKDDNSKDDETTPPPVTPAQPPSDPPTSVSQTDVTHPDENTTVTVVSTASRDGQGNGSVDTSTTTETVNPDGSTTTTQTWQTWYYDSTGGTSVVTGTTNPDGSRTITAESTSDGSTTTTTMTFDSEGHETSSNTVTSHDVKHIIIPVSAGLGNFPSESGFDLIPKAKLPQYSAPVHAAIRTYLSNLDPFLGGSEFPLKKSTGKAPPVDLIHAGVSFSQKNIEQLGGWSLFGAGIDISPQLPKHPHGKHYVGDILAVLIKLGSEGRNTEGIQAAKKAASLFLKDY